MKTNLHRGICPIGVVKHTFLCFYGYFYMLIYIQYIYMYIWTSPVEEPRNESCWTHAQTHAQLKTVSGRSWRKYGCGVISDILRLCHRFLQMGFSPPNLLTFGERRWRVIPQTPPKRQRPSLFLFLDPFPSILTGLHVCQQRK